MSHPVILHIDMDAFFTSIEVLDHPDLRGKPVIVGGAISRGVVSAASYEARKFGVHSAMSMAQAMRRCPHAIVMPHRMDRYRHISEQVMGIISNYSPLMEVVSVDEAYLDLTRWLPEGKSGEEVARELQGRVTRETGLTCSLGVATGKAIAKMASDLRKPNGLVVVPPGQEAAFLAQLSIDKLRGVGQATEKRLRALAISTIGDLARLPADYLGTLFGAHGQGLHELANGIDTSPVVPEYEAKTIGRETTFNHDISSRAHLERTLLQLSDEVASRLRRHKRLAGSVTLKLRYGDFHTLTRAMPLGDPADTTEPLYESARELLRRVNPTHAVRLIGVTAGYLLSESDQQLNLFDEQPRQRARKLAEAVDSIRERFGKSAITRARLSDNAEGDD